MGSMAVTMGFADYGESGGKTQLLSGCGSHCRSGLHLGGGGYLLPLGNSVPPLGDFNPSKSNTAHYTHAPPKRLPPCFCPPLGDFPKCTPTDDWSDTKDGDMVMLLTLATPGANSNVMIIC